MSEVGRLETTLSSLFPMPCKYGVCKIGEYSGLTVLDLLIDTDETRIGLAPEGEARKMLENQADLAVKHEQPIVLVGIYGTPRHIDHPDLNSPQLADMSAVMMVQAALDRVHSAHISGSQYRMIDENLTALWLDRAQHPEGDKGVTKYKSVYEQYYKNRLNLLKTLQAEGLINTGATKIELLSESELYESVYKKAGVTDKVPEDDFFEKCERYRQEMLSYLTASGDIIRKYYGQEDQYWNSSIDDEQLWDKCKKEIINSPEYSGIASTGWQGLIPPEMRKYYLEKFRKILGNANLAANDEMLLFHVATYLSSTLAKHNAKVLTEGLNAGAPVIRVPLAKPVDGRPPTHQSLIPQRTLPKLKGKTSKKVSNSNRAAWLSVAVQGDSKLRLVDTKDYLDTPPELIVPIQIYTVGPDNSPKSYLVDSAIMLSGAKKKIN